MMTQAQLARRSAIYAFYSRSQLLIIAEGELPTPDWDLDIAQVDESTVFELRARPRPGPPSGDATPFRYGEIFTIGRPAEHVAVRHAEGDDNVPVEFTEEDLVDIVLSLSLEDSHDVEIGGMELETSIDAANETVPVEAAPAPSESSESSEPSEPDEPDATDEPAETDETPTGQFKIIEARPRPEPRPIEVVPEPRSPILSDLNVRYREATGYSNKLSFDEAFADALKKLPPPAVRFPDMLETVEVVHIGGSFGGIAGFHRLEIRVRAYPD